MSPWRRLIALALVTLGCFGASTPAAPAYHVQAALWPGGVVPYDNAAHDQSCGPSLCPLYPAIVPPGNLRAQYDPSSNDVTLSFTRPGPPVIPSFVVPYPWATLVSYAVATVPSSALDRGCGTDADATTVSHFRWRVRPGGTEGLTTASTLASACYAVWAVDEPGRPRTEAATVRVRLG